MEIDKSLLNGALSKPSAEISSAGFNALEASDDKRIVKADIGMDLNLNHDQGQSSAAQSKRIEMIEAMRSEIHAQSRSRLQIDREDAGGRFIYRLHDLQTGEVIRQWPPDGYLDLITFLEEKRGGVINKKV